MKMNYKYKLYKLKIFFILVGNLAISSYVLATEKTNIEFFPEQKTYSTADITAILSRHFSSKIEVESISQLSSPERRNLIVRINIKNFSGEIPKSLILKQTLLKEGVEDKKKILKRFSRDWAGLEFLSNLKRHVVSSPKFYGGNLEECFILLEDLGKIHISLVDSLTKDDRDEAMASLNRFVECLGQLHADSYGKTQEYLKILHRINPNDSLQDDLSSTMDQSYSRLVFLLDQFGISHPQNMSSEISLVLKSLFEPGPFTTYIHGDPCPDNVFDYPGEKKLYFIDFEFGAVKNALLDGTYLRMGMPSCWCSKVIPEDSLNLLEESYRKQLTKEIPEASNDEKYYSAYAYACAFWMLRTVLSIQNLLEADVVRGSGPIPERSFWKKEENLCRPRVLSRLQAFIKVSKKHNKLPNLKLMAEEILEKIVNLWVDTKPMDLYPAFAEKK